MYVTVSASFDSAYQADRAVARLKSGGIAPLSVKREENGPDLERSLFVAYPYGRNFNGNVDKNVNNIPYTSGDTLIMPTPFFERRPDQKTVLNIQVEEDQLSKARGLLINCGGRDLRTRSRYISPTSPL